jgi:hypothetical protein
MGSMALLLAVRGKQCHEEYVWTPVVLPTARHYGLVLDLPGEGHANSSLNPGHNVRGMTLFATLPKSICCHHFALSHTSSRRRFSQWLGCGS